MDICMYMYICIYIYIYVHIHISIYIHIYIYIYICIYVDIHIYEHYMYTFIIMCISAFLIISIWWMILPMYISGSYDDANTRDFRCIYIKPNFLLVIALFADTHMYAIYTRLYTDTDTRKCIHRFIRVHMYSARNFKCFKQRPFSHFGALLVQKAHISVVQTIFKKILVQTICLFYPSWWGPQST